MSAPKDRGEEALEARRRWCGKIQTMPECPIRGIEDLALWHTPGVAASLAIAADPAQSWAQAARGDMVAIVSDGSRVLGLGDIGPEAAMAAMAGKALLFKHLGAVDAVPLCVTVHDADAPEVVGTPLEDVCTALIGIGAANHAVYRPLHAAGADRARIIACDSVGTLHEGRADIAADTHRLREKWQVCRDTNRGRRAGGAAEALAGADVCIAFAAPRPDVIAPDVIAPDMIAPDEIVP